MHWIPDDHVETLDSSTSTGVWHNQSYTVLDFIASREAFALSDSSVSLGFLTTKKTKTLTAADVKLHSKLSTAFAIPAWLWKAKEQDANGYFFGSFSQTAGHSSPATHVSVFRFMVKYITSIKASSAGGMSSVLYDWHILTFVIFWEAPRKVALLCFDAPPELRKELQFALRSASAKHIAAHPFFLHALVLEVVVDLYDHALWQFRDAVRALEHRRPTIDNANPDYTGMHDLARHVMHSSEVLSTALNVVGNIIDEIGRYRNSGPVEVGVGDPSPSIRHQQSMLQFMHNRSLALESRLSNEINLAFHITAQHANISSAYIAEAARIDSNATKTISILGLLFLPGTFISAIFSTSFFNYSPGSDGQPDQWRVSDKVWIFWATAVPVTIFVIGFWWLWQHRLAPIPVNTAKMTSAQKVSSDP